MTGNNEQSPKRKFQKSYTVKKKDDDDSTLQRNKETEEKIYNSTSGF